LTVIWVVQFISVASFQITMPFAPYYMQELGVDDLQALTRWVALFGAAAPLTLALFSPFWGALSDRYGRRLMILRSHAGGALILILMGLVRSVEGLVLLRLLQGAVTGTVIAAQMMVAGQTPAERSGYAMGTLAASTMSGSMFGALLGGVGAHLFGYRIPFFLAGGLQVTAFLLVLSFIRDSVPELAVSAPFPVARVRGRLQQIRLLFPLLMLAAWIGLVRQFERAYLPLLIQEIHGSLDGVALWAGGINAVGGVAGILAGVWLGRMADQMSLPRLTWIISLGAALFSLILAGAGNFGVLIPAYFVALLCAEGLEPVMQVWLVRNTPERVRGEAFGWASSARAVGSVVAPLGGGVVAMFMGVRGVFAVGALLFLCLIPTVLLTARISPPGARE
jgi:DHA1 family multidrug resistance protein-like MFS transporter